MHDGKLCNLALPNPAEPRLPARAPRILIGPFEGGCKRKRGFFFPPPTAHPMDLHTRPTRLSSVMVGHLFPSRRRLDGR